MLLAIFLALLVASPSLGVPVAQIVHCSQSTRFTVLTPMVIRAEYNQQGIFEDKPTQVFLYRDKAQASAPIFKVSNSTAWCNITTSKLVLSYYKPGSPSPAPSNSSSCSYTYTDYDVHCVNHPCRRSRNHPGPAHADNLTTCCAICDADDDCEAFAFHPNTASPNCFLLGQGAINGRVKHKGVILGSHVPVPDHPSPSPSPTNNHFVRHRLTAMATSDHTPWVWTAGDDPSDGNLLGTLFPTPSADLAGCCHNPNASDGRYDPKYRLDLGLVSRKGWAVVDDSSSPLMDWDSDLIEDAWISELPRKEGSLDWYLFGCGQDYRQCLSDYTALAGPIAFPPLSGLGVWWSRHWGDESGNKAMVDAIGVMSEENVKTQILDGYEKRNLPLHVLVMDMEWHEQMTPPGCTHFVGKSEWGGYSWNRTLFPDPQEFVSYLHAARGPGMGIKLSLNYHPDSGIDLCQTNHDEMARALGLDATKAIPDLDGPNSLNKTYVDSYFKFMIEPSLADIAWTDTPKATVWTNWLYVRYPMKKGKRTINFSRYGGLGNHRTPTGFSGDTIRKWDTLTYEVYMTPRAANVGFGWWSHDIGGFSGGVVDKDWHTEGPELFLRWLQFGALSPIMRTHCRYCQQMIWTWTDYDTPHFSWYQAMKAPLLLRNTLVPYIYTHAALRTHARGESLLTPMYWGYPDIEDAYLPANQHQYFFGRDFLVAPVTTPIQGPANVTTKTVWLPPGGWVDFNNMTKPFGRGASYTTNTYGLTQIPMWIRAGAVVPTRDMSSAYLSVTAVLTWVVAPGEEVGNGTVYEDDGDTMAFREGKSFVTTLSYQREAAHFRADISAAIGDGFTSAPLDREHRVLIGGEKALPKTATCDGKPITVTDPGDTPGVWIDTLGVVVACGPQMLLAKAHTVSVTW